MTIFQLVLRYSEHQNVKKAKCLILTSGPRLQKKGKNNEFTGPETFYAHLRSVYQNILFLLLEKMTVVLKQMVQHLTVCETL